MKTVYFDCGMGASGDMLTGALLDLLPDKTEFIDRINSLGIPGVKAFASKDEKCGIAGTHFSVTVNGSEEGTDEHTHGHSHCHGDGNECTHIHGHDNEHSHLHTDDSGSHVHSHNSLSHIEDIVRSLALTEKVTNDILAVYRLIADAESEAHGVPVEDIHFHEVGTMDALADITAFCLMMERLSVDAVLASPVCVGSGFVRCAHGVLPVPAPATAKLLCGIPIYAGSIKSELCTPTGAALLKHFVSCFCELPMLKINAVGYGTGTKTFEKANCVRVFLGEDDNRTDSVVMLKCNIDDMTAEAVGFASQLLLDSGALDVYTAPIVMKKSRPGILLCAICREADAERMARLIFRHTTTIGIRESRERRFILSRTQAEINTPHGMVRQKTCEGYGTVKSKYEYEDIARIAREYSVSIADAINLTNEALRERRTHQRLQNDA